MSVPTHAKGMSVQGGREPTLDVGTHKYFQSLRGSDPQTSHN